MTLPLKFEWAKLQRTPLKVATVAIPAVGSLVALVIPLQHPGSVWWDYIAASLTITHAVLIPLAMGLTATFVFGREYVDGTASWLRLSRYAAWQVVAAKCLVVLSLGALMTALALASALLFGLFARLDGFYWALVGKYVVAGVLACVIAASTAPLFALVATWQQDYFLASALALATPLSGLLTMSGAFSRLNPWGLPMLYVSRFLSLVLRDPVAPLTPIWRTALVTAVIGLLGTVAVQSRANILSER